MSRVSLEQVVEELRAERLLPDDAAAKADALLGQLRAVQPWYVRAMVGFGAWLASLLLIGSVAGLGILVGGYLFVGLAFVAGAVALRRQSDNDFMVQATLAVSIAGQALFAWGLADAAPAGEVKWFCAAVVLMNGLLFFLFPDRIHRVLSVVFATSALAVLLYAYEWNAAVPVLGPALAAGLVWLHQHRARVTAAGYGHLVRPLASGLMLSAFGYLMLSTVYLLPELGVDFRFYPRPWVSTVLLGALFLYVGRFCLPALTGGAGKAAEATVYGLMLVLIACAWLAPGLLLALIVLMLGTAEGDRPFVGAGIGFLAVFVGAYFYGIEVTMLTKSMTLVASGAAVLIARWVVLRVFDASGERGVKHAG